MATVIEVIVGIQQYMILDQVIYETEKKSSLIGKLLRPSKQWDKVADWSGHGVIYYEIFFILILGKEISEGRL